MWAWGLCYCGEQQLHLPPWLCAPPVPLYHLSIFVICGSGVACIKECVCTRFSVVFFRSFDLRDFLRIIRDFKSPVRCLVSPESIWLVSTSENNFLFILFLSSALDWLILACKFESIKNFVLSSAFCRLSIREISRDWSSVTSISPSKLASGAFLKSFFDSYKSNCYSVMFTYFVLNADAVMSTAKILSGSWGVWNKQHIWLLMRVCVEANWPVLETALGHINSRNFPTCLVLSRVFSLT